MKQRTFSDQQIAQYLLGSASDAERLDELSFTDEEFVVRLQAVENDLVDAYVRGELSGETLERFDLHYLSSPLRHEKVVIARGLKDYLGSAVGVEQVGRHDWAAKARWESLRRYFFVPKLGLQVGLAAALVLMLAAGSWLAVNNRWLRHQAIQSQTELADLQRRELELREQIAQQRSSDVEKAKELANVREQMAQLQRRVTGLARQQSPPRSAPSHIVSFALEPQMRSRGQIAMIAIPPDAESVALKLDLEAGNFPAYRAELKAQPGNLVVWTSSKLRATDVASGKAVVVSLRPGLLKPQRYVLELSGISGDGRVDIVGSYLFAVTKP